GADEDLGLVEEVHAGPLEQPPREMNRARQLPSSSLSAQPMGRGTTRRVVEGTRRPMAPPPPFVRAPSPCSARGGPGLLAGYVRVRRKEVARRRLTRPRSRQSERARHRRPEERGAERGEAVPQRGLC